MLHNRLRVFGIAFALATLVLSPFTHATGLPPLNKAEFILEGSGVAPGQTSVATNGNGTFLSVWYKNNEIWGQYSQRGQLIDEEFPIVSSSNNIDTSQSMRLLMNKSGNAIVLWIGTDHKIYAKPIPVNSTAETLTSIPFVVSINYYDNKNEVTINTNASIQSRYRFAAQMQEDGSLDVHFYTGPSDLLSSFDQNGTPRNPTYGAVGVPASQNTSNTPAFFFSMYPNALQEKSFGSMSKWFGFSVMPFSPITTSTSNFHYFTAVAHNQKGTTLIVYLCGNNDVCADLRDKNSSNLLPEGENIKLGDIYSKPSSGVDLYHVPFELAATVDENNNFAVSWVSLEYKVANRHTDEMYGEFRWDFSTTVNAQAFVDGKLVYTKTYFSKYDHDDNLLSATIAKKSKTIMSDLRMSSNAKGEVAMTWTENKFNAKQTYMELSGMNFIEKTGVVQSVIKARKYNIKMKPVGPLVSVAKPGKIKGSTTSYFTVRRPEIALDDAGSFQVNWEKITSTDGVVSTNAMARFFPGKGVK